MMSQARTVIETDQFLLPNLFKGRGPSFDLELKFKMETYKQNSNMKVIQQERPFSALTKKSLWASFSKAEN